MNRPSVNSLQVVVLCSIVSFPYAMRLVGPVAQQDFEFIPCWCKVVPEVEPQVPVDFGWARPRKFELWFRRCPSWIKDKVFKVSTIRCCNIRQKSSLQCSSASPKGPLIVSGLKPSAWKISIMTWSLSRGGGILGNDGGVYQSVVMATKASLPRIMVPNVPTWHTLV